MRKSTSSQLLFAGIVVGIIGVGIIIAGIFFLRPYLQGTAKTTGSPSEAPPPLPQVEAVPSPPPPKPAITEAKKEEPKPAPPKEPSKPPPEKPEATEMADAAADAELEKRVSERYPLPEIKPLEVIVDNWNNVPKRAFPKGVTISEPLEFKLFHDGIAIGGRTVPAGAHVIPIDLLESTLIVAPDIQSIMKAEIPVDSTNFKNLIYAHYTDFVQRQHAKVTAARATELARLKKLEAHETSLADFNDGSDPRFDPMKASLRNGEAGSFELEFATQWRWLGTEEVDGVTYDVGLAVFETESAFGVSRTEIKAFLREGKVERWVNAASGEPV